MRMLTKPIYLSLLIIALGLPACNMRVKVSNYPEDFVYLKPAKVQSKMGRLSLNLQRINNILEDRLVVSATDREQIVAALADMEAVVRELGASAPQKTNHLVIDQHLDSFKQDVRSARTAVEKDPPNYYLAGQLAGSCLACHIYR